MPMDEQKELWSRINKAFTRIGHFSKEVSRATDLLDRLDQAALAKAFRGDLVPQECAEQKQREEVGCRMIR